MAKVCCVCVVLCGVLVFCVTLAKCDTKVAGICAGGISGARGGRLTVHTVFRGLGGPPGGAQKGGFSGIFGHFLANFGPPARARPSKSLTQNPPPHFLLTKKYIY